MALAEFRTVISVLFVLKMAVDSGVYWDVVMVCVAVVRLV